MPMTYDTAYLLACEHARDDHFLFGIDRSDAEVEADAKRMYLANKPD